MRGIIDRLLALAIIGALGCGSNSTSTDEETEDTTCRTESGEVLPTAPEDQRVDLYDAVFSDPTSVTNPLFPVSEQRRVLLLGTEDGERFRVEVTLLPTPLVVEWDDKEIETLVSQYVAYIDGRLKEVALDLYGQDDSGAVWYFGEDVFNYEDGIVADLDGTWRAGEEADPGMIMPANPAVDDVWRPENVCGVVFEEVTAKSVGVSVEGPRGTVDGAVIVEELHDDGSYEDKTFAPGYGEFFSGSGADEEAVGLMVPIDALAGGVPASLGAISDDANDVFDFAAAEAWDDAVTSMASLRAAWQTYAAGGTPTRLATQMDDAVDALDAAVGANEAEGAQHAALDVILAALDFELRYRPVVDVDLDLLDLWTRRLLLDMAAQDRNAMFGDIATLRWIRDRLANDAVDRAGVDRALASLTNAVEAAARSNDEREAFAAPRFSTFRR